VAARAHVVASPREMIVVLLPVAALPQRLRLPEHRVDRGDLFGGGGSPGRANLQG